MSWYSSKHAQIHNGSPLEADSTICKTWKEWMGYKVHYMNHDNDGPYIDQSTDYGVSFATAVDTMKNILQTGRCAWIVKVDPDSHGDVPF